MNMNFVKQVDRSHYGFTNYMDKARWSSVWHQLDEVINLCPETVLEIGPGPGLFKTLGKIFGINIETVDIDPELNPDHLASATDLPFYSSSYEVVVAFQMLEHLSYNESIDAFNEMVRVAKRYVIVSLPDVKPVWKYMIYIPKVGQLAFHFPRPFAKAMDHIFVGEHYWEINKVGYPLARIISDTQRHDLKLIKTFRVFENPYHRFFIFNKISQE